MTLKTFPFEIAFFLVVLAICYCVEYCGRRKERKDQEEIKRFEEHGV